MITVVAGTRPNFMKVAPVHRALEKHTGQHFDAAMSEVFFRDLGLPSPTVRLYAGGGTQAEQTATALVGIEADLVRNRPSLVVVVGDVTSTLAGALALSGGPARAAGSSTAYSCTGGDIPSGTYSSVTVTGFCDVAAESR